MIINVIDTEIKFYLFILIIRIIIIIILLKNVINLLFINLIDIKLTHNLTVSWLIFYWNCGFFFGCPAAGFYLFYYQFVSKRQRVCLVDYTNQTARQKRRNQSVKYY